MVGQQPNTVQREVARVANKRRGVVILLNVLFKSGLGFRRAHGVVVPGEHEALHPLRKQLQEASKFTVLGEQVGDGEFFVLSGVNAYAVNAIAGENEVLDRLCQRVGVEPSHHLVPLCLEEGLRADVNVGKERYANSCLRTHFVVLVLKREMQIINVENVPRLTERAGDAHDIVGHQAGFQDLFMSTVSVVTAAFRKQAGHLTCFVFEAPHQMAVLGVAWFIDQADGDRFVVVALVARILGEKT